MMDMTSVKDNNPRPGFGAVLASVSVDTSPSDVRDTSEGVFGVHACQIYLELAVPSPVEWDHIQWAFQIGKPLIFDQVMYPRSMTYSAH